MENPADFCQVVAQINLAARKGDPEKRPERTGHFLDLFE
jgi:hypothetical protein